MTLNGVTSSLPALSLLVLLTTSVALSAPTLADHPLQIHLTEWRTLPTGERVSCSEKRHRHHMESWKRTTAEASVQQWRESKVDAATASSTSPGRSRLHNSRNLVAANTTTTEVNALLAFRNAIHTDPTGALANWTSGNVATHCSTWNGVICDETGRVTGIELMGLGLNGTIAPTIGDLAQLSLLNLSWSSLSGPIPSQLGRCQELSVLDLSHNSLDGKVPPELFTLPNLGLLRLSYNKISGSLPEVEQPNGCRSMSSLWIGHTNISGTLPSSLSSCQNLTLLSFSYNQLDGSIPAVLGELHNLQQLYLEYNSFTGHIPSQLGSLKKLQILVLEGNNLDGLIPPFLGTLSELQVLDLKYNKLTGLIPPFLGNCSSLAYLWLGYNQLTGTIPEELGNLSSIVEIGFEYNTNLTGPVPGFLSKCSTLSILFLGACGFTSIAPEIWSMKSLEQIALFSNKLTGELPLEVGNCSSLAWLDLGWYPNMLTGSIPPTLGKLTNLTTLSLMMNVFTGGISIELGNLNQLQMLWLGRNEALGGLIPREVSNLTTLVEIDLGYANLSGVVPDDLLVNNLNIKKLLLNNNNLTGPLPKSVGKLKDLEVLYLQFNNLNGGIPIEIGSCSNLTDIALANNQLNGTIPASLGKLSNLQATLDLSSNHLTGNIPVALGNLTKLQRLTLSTNKLNGTIPNNLGNCVALNLLDLSSNYFTGDIPKFLGNLSMLVSLDISNNMLNDDAAALSSLNQCPNLETLRVGQNKIYGSLPLDFTKWPSLKYFSVADNELTGRIPTSFGSVNSTLVLVDFSQNKFSGEIPTQVDGTQLPNLRVLMFSYNQIEGTIPSWIENLKSLQVLDLSFNKLTGSIPKNFGYNLDGYKVQSNESTGSPSAAFTLNQRLNLTFKGDTVSYSYILQATTFMDMSSNALEGEIPVGITSLVGLKYLILSNNKFEGNIWTTIENLGALESLDLSQNNLSGPLPPILPSLVGTFNVSFNNLNGVIPTGGQYDTFTSAYYLPGNLDLCGVVIDRPCTIEDGIDPILHEFVIADYISFLGFGIGAASGFGIVMMTCLFWAPAQIFVFEAIEKRKTTAKIQPAYGLFNHKF